MKNILINKLSPRDNKIDTKALIKVILEGKPIKILGFIKKGFGAIGLFEELEGENIFHLLVHKKLASIVIPIIFNNADKILARENIKTNPQEFLTKLINTPNKDGFTPAHLAAYYCNPTELKTLVTKGAEILYPKPLTEINKKSKFKLLDYPPISLFLNKVIQENLLIPEGVADLFKLICEDKNACNLITNYLPDIIKHIQNSQNPNATKLFFVIFEIFWLDVIANDTNNREVLNKIIKLCDVIKNYKNSWSLSLQELNNLFGITVNTTNSNDVQKQLLQNCALEFLKGNIASLNLETLLNHSTIKQEKFDAIITFINTGFIKDNQQINPLNDITNKLIINNFNSEIQSIKINDNLNSALDSSTRNIVPKLTKSKSQIKEVISKEITIEEYAKGLEWAINNSKCKEYITQRLGDNYTKLHSFIVMASYKSFTQVLDITAKKLKAKPKIPSEFLKEYISTLTLEDLSVINQQHSVDAFDLSCKLNDVNTAKLILKRGFDLKLYNKDTVSIFEGAIKFHSTDILQYLLNQQKDIEIDWLFIVDKAFKYAEPIAIQHYIDSEAEIIKDIFDKAGNTTPGGKYSVLNKTLDRLIYIVSTNVPNIDKNAIFNKLAKVNECLTKIIQNNKIFYSLEPVVIRKTIELLSKLNYAINNVSNTPEIKEELEKTKFLVIDGFKNIDTSEDIAKKLEHLKNNEMNCSTYSDTTMITHISALSDLDYGGYDIDLIGVNNNYN